MTSTGKTARITAAWRETGTAAAKRLARGGSSVAVRSAPRSGRSLVERLETRQLLSADPAALAAAGFEPIEWNGQIVIVKIGQWIVAFDTPAGPPATQLDSINGSLQKLAPDLKATRHLGSKGLVVVESSREATLE